MRRLDNRPARQFSRHAHRSSYPYVNTAAPASGRPQRFRQPEENPAPRSELRCADADAGAIADLVDLVEDVDHIEARRQRARAGDVEHMGQTRIDLSVVGQMFAIGNVGAAVAVGLAGRQKNWVTMQKQNQIW